MLSHTIVAYVAFNFGLVRTGSKTTNATVKARSCSPCVSSPPHTPMQQDFWEGKSFNISHLKQPIEFPDNATEAEKLFRQKQERNARTGNRFARVENCSMTKSAPFSNCLPKFTTTPPNLLPGAFANNSLYLQGIRLTTSYEASILDVHVDLFGFPGHLTRLETSQKKTMGCQRVTDNFNETLWGREEIKGNVTLFCQLGSNGIRNASLQDGQEHNLMKMFFVPMVSLDVNQDLAAPFLWRCNITGIVNKPQLLNRIGDIPVTGLESLPVHIWMQQHHLDTVTKVASFQIPLDTGAIGVGNPHVRGGLAESFFQQPPVPVGLCLAVHGSGSLRYLSEFVQHHLNVGFSSILIGLQGPHDGDDLRKASYHLSSYIKEGVVALAHYSAPFGTIIDATKLQFYLPCLYHYKGLAKYVATWDVDEYWTPPEFLHADGRHKHPHFKFDGGLVESTETTASSSVVNASLWYTFPPMVQKDPLWQASRYAESVSIADTINAIDRYYVGQGCVTSFCYHSFPSRLVFFRSGLSDENRTYRIGHDFHLRQGGYANTWMKSIVSTKYAHGLGFHHGGSCFFEKQINMSLPSSILESMFHAHTHNDVCYARRFEQKTYGTLHHFFDMVVKRNAARYADSNVTQLDEFVSFFAPIVESQLLLRRAFNFGQLILLFAT